MRGLILRSVLGAGGGAEKIILRTAAILKGTDPRLTVCAIRRADDADYDFDQQCESLGIDYVEVMQDSTFGPQVWRQLAELVSQGDFDFVHAHDYKAVYYARKIAQTFGIPSIATLHGWTGNSWKERYFYYPLERRLLRSFDRVLAVSTDLKDTYLASGGDPAKVDVILNGIDASQFQPNPDRRESIRAQLGIAPDEKFLLGLGRLERQKRFDLMIDMLQLARDRGHRTWKVLIAGEGSLKASLQEQINRQGLGDHCRLLGHRSDVRSLFDGADLLVQSSDYEGTPTVVVEAMAMRLPVVATDAGGTRELMQDRVHGRVVPCRDLEALIKGISETFEQPEVATGYVHAARQRAETELSFENRTAKLVTFYQRLVPKPAQS